MLTVLGLGQFERLVLHVHVLHVHALHVHVLHVRCYVGWGDRIFVGFRLKMLCVFIWTIYFESK